MGIPYLSILLVLPLVCLSPAATSCLELACSASRLYGSVEGKSLKRSMGLLRSASPRTAFILCPYSGVAFLKLDTTSRRCVHEKWRQRPTAPQLGQKFPVDIGCYSAEPSFGSAIFFVCHKRFLHALENNPPADSAKPVRWQLDLIYGASASQMET